MQDKDNCCENNLKDISVLSETLQQSIRGIAQKEGYTNYNVHAKKVSTDGGNYLGILYEVDIKGETGDGEKEINLFVKNIINPELVKDFFSLPDVYLRESFAYKELSKIFTDLQNKANIPLEDRYNMVKGYEESNSEAIILENAARKGYKSPNRMDIPSLKFTEVAIQQLARFHGLSFVIQKQRPNFDNQLVSMKMPLEYNQPWKKGVLNLINISIKKDSPETKKKVEGFIETLYDLFPRYLHGRDTISCLCHGDFRPNNMLMKEIDGVVTTIIPVDMQLMHYGCPVNDFIYFIYSCTDRQFRTNHLEHLKNMYYESLRKFLQYFDMDVESYFSWKKFEDMYKDRLDYGLLVVLYYYPFIFAPEDDVPDIGNENIQKFELTLNNKTYEMIQEVVDDFIKWGYL